MTVMASHRATADLPWPAMATAKADLPHGHGHGSKTNPRKMVLRLCGLATEEPPVCSSARSDRWASVRVHFARGDNGPPRKDQIAQ